MYEDKDCILILGCSLSGKTTLSRTYTSTHKIIHTDDYMNFGDYRRTGRLGPIPRTRSGLLPCEGSRAGS